MYYNTGDHFIKLSEITSISKYGGEKPFPYSSEETPFYITFLLSGDHARVQSYIDKATRDAEYNKVTAMVGKSFDELFDERLTENVLLHYE